jgi:endonuclease YncB( thermonuclease family)
MRFIAGLLFAFCASASAAPHITFFYDGDTVRIKEESKEYKLRIGHIDAPERNQVYGKKSRRALMMLCKNAAIQVIITGKDKYQRSLGKLYCNQQDVAKFMVKNGHAWFYHRYSKDSFLALNEKNARKNKLGLWQDEKAIAPWAWRKRHKAQHKDKPTN